MEEAREHSGPARKWKKWGGGGTESGYKGCVGDVKGDTQKVRHSDTQTFRHVDTQTLRH